MRSLRDAEKITNTLFVVEIGENRYIGRYIQGRSYERLTAEEYAREVPEKTRLIWAEHISQREWGAGILLAGGFINDIKASHNYTPARVRELMELVRKSTPNFTFSLY